MRRSYGTLLCKSYRNSIHFIKTYQRAVGSAYIVGMDFNPSTIADNLFECRRYGIFNLKFGGF